MNIYSAWKSFITALNSRGIPVPMVRYKGEGNPALTLVTLSSILVMIGIVGKWSGYLGGVDIKDALQYFYASSALFFGHSFTGQGQKDAEKNHVDVDPRLGPS